MTDYNTYEWDCIDVEINDILEFFGVSLAGITPKNRDNFPLKSFVAITLHPPLTKRWLSLSSSMQCRVLSAYFEKMIKSIHVEHGIKYRYIFEYHTNGNVHLHGYMTAHNDNFYVNGLIADLAKCYHNSIKTVYQYKKFDSKYNKYVIASCDIKYIESRADQYRWIMYLSKEQDKTKVNMPSLQMVAIHRKKDLRFVVAEENKQRQYNKSIIDLLNEQPIPHKIVKSYSMNQLVEPKKQVIDHPERKKMKKDYHGEFYPSEWNHYMDKEFDAHNIPKRMHKRMQYADSSEDEKQEDCINIPFSNTIRYVAPTAPA